MPSPPIAKVGLLASVLSSIASALRLGDLSDCGSPSFNFTGMAIAPDPPLPGLPASLNATGVLTAAVSGGNVSVNVLYLGLDLFSASAFTCGNTTIELPLGAGEINVYGFQNCPAPANSAQTINMTVTLPTVTPPGDYQLILNGSDAALNPIWCLNASFTE